MPAPRVVPDPAELRDMFARGLTTQDVADEVFHRTGQRVTRAAISAAWSRAGLPSRRARYVNLIPWRVKMRHAGNFDLEMLRAESARRSGKPLPPTTQRKLDSWISKMRANDVVVRYEPDTEEGFFKVRRRPGIDTDLIWLPDVEQPPVEASVPRARARARV